MRGSPWPAHRGGSGRSGISPYQPATDLFFTSAPDWTFKPGNSAGEDASENLWIYASPVVGSNGTVFYGNSQGTVYAVSADGTQKWYKDLGGAIMSTIALGADDRMFVGVTYENATLKHLCDPSVFSEAHCERAGWFGRMIALNIEGGGILAQVNVDGPVVSSPALYGERMYVGTERGTMYCIDVNTLRVIWSRTPHDPQPPDPSDPKASEDPRHPIESPNLYGGSIVASPAVDSFGNVYFAVSFDRDRLPSATDPKQHRAYSMYKYSPAGVHQWRFLAGYVLHSTPAIDEQNGVLYFGGHDNRIVALNLATGLPSACAQTTDAVSASPALLPDGSLVYATEDGHLKACSPGCRELLWSANVDGPVVAAVAAGESGAATPPPRRGRAAGAGDDVGALGVLHVLARGPRRRLHGRRRQLPRRDHRRRPGGRDHQVARVARVGGGVRGRRRRLAGHR